MELHSSCAGLHCCSMSHTIENLSLKHTLCDEAGSPFLGSTTVVQHSVCTSQLSVGLGLSLTANLHSTINPQQRFFPKWLFCDRTLIHWHCMHMREGIAEENLNISMLAICLLLYYCRLSTGPSYDLMMFIDKIFVT